MELLSNQNKYSYQGLAPSVQLFVSVTSQNYNNTSTAKVSRTFLKKVEIFFLM